MKCACLCINSGDSDEWIHTADSVVELLALLRRRADLTAEFFLLCLEVCRTTCTLYSTLNAGLYHASQCMQVWYIVYCGRSLLVRLTYCLAVAEVHCRIFTALHGMQSWSSDENSVRPTCEL